MLLKDARYCQFIGYVRYVSALARTKVLFPAGAEWNFAHRAHLVGLMLYRHFLASSLPSSL
jgi:hypothetical protein